ncbi:MAG: sll1863 family stress response protein [Microbacterium sp.]
MTAEPEHDDVAPLPDASDPRHVALLVDTRRGEEQAEALAQVAVAARLDAWHARIQALRVQAHLAGLDARDDAALPLGRIEARLDHARDRLRQLARESADVWTVLLEAYESTRDELAAAAKLVEERVTH